MNSHGVFHSCQSDLLQKYSMKNKEWNSLFPKLCFRTNSNASTDEKDKDKMLKKTYSKEEEYMNMQKKLTKL